MKSNVIKIDFETVKAINLDNQVSLRDVHTKLVEKGWSGDQFTDWAKSKLEFYEKGKDYTQLREKVKTGKGASGWQVLEEYYTTVQVAMEILASGHGATGHEMRRFMSECVRLVVENKIAIPFDMHDPYSILQWATAEFGKKEVELQAERQLRIATETVAESLTGKLTEMQSREEAITEVGDRIGTSAYLKYRGIPLRHVMAHTQMCKDVCRKRGIKLQSSLNRYDKEYYLFPRSVHEYVCGVANNYKGKPNDIHLQSCFDRGSDSIKPVTTPDLAISEC